jgi:hypothetical protein
MNRFIACTMLLALTVNITNAQSQKNTTESAAKQKPPTSFIEKLLKFLGIADSPSTLKGPGDEVASGELWVADLDSRTTRALTSTDGYRSPVFVNGSKDILALRGTDVVRIPSPGGEGRKAYSVFAITKLVGSSSEDPGKVLILLQGGTDGRPRVGLLTISTGATTMVPYDASSDRDLQMVESLQGWSRTYGDQQIYVKRQSKQALSGTLEWTDVFRRVGNGEPVDVSQCDGANCGQPSLSDDKHLIVFVKARAE